MKDSPAGGRRPYEALGRQGAVRKRKGDIFEMNGHKFVQRQFYQPIMCALCQEFLLTGEGYQCEDCRYACHKKCYPKVVTKCISKSNADAVSRCLSWVNSADRSRRVTRKRLIIGFRIASLRTRICRRTGAVIAVTCCPSAGRTRSSAQVSTSPCLVQGRADKWQNALSHAIRPVRILFPTFAG